MAETTNSKRDMALVAGVVVPLVGLLGLGLAIGLGVFFVQLVILPAYERVRAGGWHLGMRIVFVLGLHQNVRAAVAA